MSTRTRLLALALFALTVAGCVADQAKTCTVGGVVHQIGDSFPSDDGCNTCSCGQDAQVACTTRACAKTCIYDGVERQPGTTFPSTDGCNTCSCGADGQVACTEIACADTCSAEHDCPEGSGMCYRPGQDVGCGICQSPPEGATCDSDGACNAGEICEPLRCACAGERTCVPGCGADSPCGEGQQCGASGRCVALACGAEGACPPNFRCDGGGCLRQACTASESCDGFCVLGACYAEPGFCTFPPP